MKKSILLAVFTLFFALLPIQCIIAEQNAIADVVTTTTSPYKVTYNGDKDIAGDNHLNITLGYPCKDLYFKVQGNAWSINNKVTIYEDETYSSETEKFDAGFTGDKVIEKNHSIKTSTKIIKLVESGNAENLKIFALTLPMAPHTRLNTTSFSFNTPLTDTDGEVQTIDFYSFLAGTSGVTASIVDANGNQTNLEGQVTLQFGGTDYETLSVGANTLEKIDENNCSFQIKFTPKKIITNQTIYIKISNPGAVDNPDVRIPVTISSSLPAPALKCDQSGYTFAKLSWNAIDGAESYYLYDNGNLVGTYTTNTVTLTDLEYGSNHSYTVTSVVGSAESNRSNAVAVNCPAYPSVTGINFTNIQPNQVTVNWNHVDITPANHTRVRYHIHFYKIAAGAVGGEFIKATTTTNNYYTFDGLIDNTQYTAYVDVEYQYTLDGVTENVHKSNWSSQAVVTGSFIPTTAFNGVKLYKGEWHRINVNSPIEVMPSGRGTTEKTYTFQFDYPCNTLSYQAWISEEANNWHNVANNLTGTNQDITNGARFSVPTTNIATSTSVNFIGTRHRNGAKNLYVDNIYAKIVPHIVTVNPTRNDLSKVEIGSTARLDVDFKSFLTNGTITATTSDKSQFLIDGSMESKTIASGYVLETTSENTHNFHIVFAPKSVGTHTATITITDGVSTVELTVTGECIKKTPTITWTNNRQIVYGTTVANAATSTCGSAITYSSDNTEVIKIENNALVPVGIGTANITATTAGNGTYYSTTSTAAFEVTKKTLQEIVWNQAFFNLKIGGANITLDAYTINKETGTANNLPIAYSVENSGVVKVNNGVLEIVGLGTTSITATQAGDDTYAAISRTMTVVVRENFNDCSGEYALADANEYAKGDATWGGLTWNSLEKTFTLSTIGDKLSFVTSVNSSATDTQVKVTDQAGNTIYDGGFGTRSNIQLSRSVKSLKFYLHGNWRISLSNIIVTPAIYLEQKSENIVFPNTERGNTGNASISFDWANQPDLINTKIVDDAAGVFSVDPNSYYFGGSCGDYGTSTVKLFFKPTTAGTYTAKLAVYVGESTEAKLLIPITATAIKTPQFITWNQDLAALNPTQGGSYDLSATASSGLAVVFTSSDENVARIENGKLVILNAGSATIYASQAGDDNYEAAGVVSQTITVSRLDQTIVWEQQFDEYLTVGETYQLSATTTAGYGVYFTSSDDNIAHINGNQLTIRSIGSATITAHQGGSNNYNPAPDVSKTITAKNVNISGNELPINYYTTEFYGKITRKVTLTAADIADWMWISSPYDAEITVKIGNTEIPLTWKGNPSPDACYLLKSYDAEARSTGAVKPWVDVQTVAGNPIIEAGKGYIIGIDPGSYSGECVVTYSSVNSENASNNQGYTTVNNDYTSTIAALANNHLVGTGLFETPSGLDFLADYETVYFAIPNGGGYEYIENDFARLAPYSAFFMQYGGEYTFTTSLTRQNAPALYTKKNSTERYQINIAGGAYSDKTMILMSHNGSEGYTAGQDFFYMTQKAGGSNVANQFYSLDGEQPLSFNHRKDENQIINLGGRVKVAGEYTISLADGVFNAQSVVLVDNYTGETVDLLTDDYTFTAESGSLDGRFVITFAFAPSITTDIFSPEANQIIVYGTADACTIGNLIAGEQVMIFDAMGRMIYGDNADSETLNIALPADTYIVRQADSFAKFVVR